MRSFSLNVWRRRCITGAREETTPMSIAKHIIAPAAIIVAWLTLMSFWLYRLNEALQRFSALYIIAVMQSMWMTNSIVGGGIFFEEFVHESTGNILLFALGVSV